MPWVSGGDEAASFADGKDDEGQFYRACESLYQILKQKGAQVQNHLFDGAHDAAYILSNMKTYLRFYGA